MNKRLRKKTYEYRLVVFYSKIGEIANLSSMIEYNLIQIISEKTLLGSLDGKESVYLHELNQFIKDANVKYKSMNEYSVLKDLINDAFGSYGLSLELKDILHNARKKRNYYIHDLFQEDLMGKKWIFTKPDYYFREMNRFIEELHKLNSILVSIDYNNREIIESWE